MPSVKKVLTPPHSRYRRQYLGAFAALARLMAVAFLLLAGQPVLAQTRHTLPFVTPASNTSQRSLVRIINRSDRAGTVTIHGIDDSGERFGPVSLRLRAKQTKHLDSRRLEGGATLSGGVGLGNGEGNWRLELETQLDILPLAYIRGAQGFATTMHDVVRGEAMRHHVLTFNKAPVSLGWSRSQLRLINPTDDSVDVTITGHDDYGNPGAGAVSLSLPAGASRTLTAHQLEGGDDDFEGSLGDDGKGRWQLFVSANRPIQVMNLMLSPNTGYMTNLSSMKGDDVIRGSAGGDVLYGTNGDDVINPGDNATSSDRDADRGYDTVHGSMGDDMIIYTDSGAEASQELWYSDPDEGDYLSTGITATIDGAANRAAVDKGSAGTDTIVNVANPLNASGFRLLGTNFNDVFHLTIDDDQYMNVAGGAGNDRLNVRLIDDGRVLVDYGDAPDGVNVDLRAGRASNDGFGGVDRFTGDIPKHILGSEFSDVLRGSDRNEWFFGRGGNDSIDGGGGRDMLQFSHGSRFSSYVGVRDLDVDLDTGTATGTLNGSPFSYSISNIERVWGGVGNDTIRGAVEEVRASTGNDTITYTDGIVYSEMTYAYLTMDGITATINGIANSATVNKGSAGTDTLVDIAKPLTGGGFGLYGTSSNDVFNLTLDDNQWMQVGGGAGNDTINMQAPYARIDYSRGAQNGIDVDLRAGRANDDGFGDVDTIRGAVFEVRGTDFKDVIRGSDNNDSFIGRAGDDVLDGRGGFDRVSFNRSCCTIRNLEVDLGAGTATGTWNGNAFSYTLSSIEYVRGSDGDNTFRGSPRDERFRGGAGEDTFIFERGHGHDRIEDFTDGVDVIVLLGLGISKSDVLNNAWAWDEGVGVRIDLTGFGGGRIDLHGFRRENLDESDFLL